MATNFLVENNVLISTFVPGSVVIADPIYEPRGTFSINASNQLQATFWASKNGQLVTSNLGTASYTVYDKDGNTVGLTQSGIIADANAQFIITPVSALSITDLTHYVVKVSIDVDSIVVSNYLGITLGE